MPYFGRVIGDRPGAVCDALDHCGEFSVFSRFEFELTESTGGCRPRTRFRLSADAVLSQFRVYLREIWRLCEASGSTGAAPQWRCDGGAFLLCQVNIPI